MPYRLDYVGIQERVNDALLASIASAETTRQNASASAHATYDAGVLAGDRSSNASLAAALAAADQARADAGRNAAILRDRLAELIRKAPDILAGTQSQGALQCNFDSADAALEALQVFVPELAPYVTAVDVIQVS